MFYSIKSPSKIQEAINIAIPTHKPEINPLSIEAMRKKSYPGSTIKIEESLENGTNYKRFLVSYQSEGLKIYGLFTVPEGDKPGNGWPVIIFNHGYIPPEEYSPTEKYIAYVDGFARNGYIVFRPDFRGNGDSEGEPEGAYYSPGYATDALNAIASVKKYPEANPDNIGMWGHSMGGNVIMRDLVTMGEIKAAVIWGGVVGSYHDLMNNWQRKVPYKPSPRELSLRNKRRQEFIRKYGTPSSNPVFWNSIDPTAHLNLIQTPIQLHHSTTDEEVPVAFSESLADKLKKADKTVELYTYPGDNHNINANFNTAMERSLDFFDKYLKN